jgi:hypothetical protein
MLRNSVLVSGKLGDLIHSMYIPHFLFRSFGVRSVIYITDEIEPFGREMTKTMGDIVPLLTQQPFFYDMKKWNGEPIQFNTSLFRKSPLLYRDGWTNIMHNLYFSGSKPILGPWMEVLNSIEDSGLVISRVYKEPLVMSDQLIEWYAQKIKEYGGAIFVGTEYDFQKFPLNQSCYFIPNYDLELASRIISAAKLFIGNQSSPLALAWSLGVNRAVELLPEPHPDFIHYEAEKQYYNFELIRPK